MTTSMRRRRIRRILWVLGATVAASSGHYRASALDNASFSAVNWSLVSPAAIAAAQIALLAPIGCKCVGSSSSGQCPFFDCACSCDLTAGACDAFCCCDAECTIDHVASVRSQGLCVDVEKAKPSIEYCSLDLTLTDASSGVNALLADSVLCVAVDNNEVVGDYISTPKEQSMTVAKAFAQNPKQYAFSRDSTNADSSSSSAKRSVYFPGDSIPVFSADANKSIHGPILLGWGPTSGSTRCSQRMPVRFAKDWEESSCVLDGVDLATACGASGGLLDPSAASLSLLIAKMPSVVSATAASKDVVSVEVIVQEVDITSGNVTVVIAPYPSYFPEPQHVTNTTSNISTCAGALVGASFTISHNGSGVIDRVSAVVTIANVSSFTANATLVDITQSFSVRFVSTAAITRSLEKGNVATYDRSGNPGYQLHLPVRVGILEPNTSTSQAISEMTGGLTLPALDDCDDLSTTPVLFGEDAQLTCTLRLNASAFQSFCDSSLIPSALRVNFTHVATFGNSDPFLVDEWLSIDYDEPTKSVATFTDASGAGTVEMQCNNVLSSLHFEFLVAPVGAVNNPQNKIVAARASHGKDAWTFWKNPQDPSKQEIYLLTRTVSFVTVKTLELDQWIPPTPPIWFSIPSDVFYPFQLSSGSHHSASWPLQVILWLGVSFMWILGE